MPRSSKHKSSKHSSRDTREYSDSEKDSGLKDRKSKEESVTKVSKDSSLSEKRKLDSKDVKDLHDSGNGDYSDEYGSSKRRKERNNDGVGDRWNGGEDDRGEVSRKSRSSGDSKSRKRDESTGVYGEYEEVKKSSGKAEGKHKDSGRKESREGGAEKEKKFKECRRERSVDKEEQRMSKQVFENTDLKASDDLRSPEHDSQLERRMRKKRGDSGDADKHQDDIGESYNRRMSSRDDIGKDGRQKDEKRKDEKYKDKYREELDKENKHRHDKQRDEHPTKEHTSNKSDDKYTREEKDSVESRRKRTKLLESDRDRDHNRARDGDRDHDLEPGRDRERHHGRDRDRDCDGIDRDHDCDRDRDWDWDRDRDRDRHCDRDGSHVDEQSGWNKESGSKKRSLDDHDDYSDTKSRVVKTHYSDADKKSLNSGRADSDADRGRSQSRRARADSTGTSNKRRSSPTSNSHIGKDEYRNSNSEDIKYRDSIIEQRTKSSREGFSGLSERSSKYKSMEKPIRIDDGPVGDMSTERSSSSKASPMARMERSPSSTSFDRRYVNKSGVRRSLEIEETGWRNSSEARDFSASEDRLGRDLTLEKPMFDESSQADSSFYGRTSQGNSSLVPPPPGFRGGLDRPFMGSLEDDGRDNNARYRRSNDPGFGRGHGNSWRGVPNWTSPVPNGFVPFQHGPTHGSFQAMMPQFPSQPLFGVRPPMEVNHAGIPYHIPDADRFPGHLRPLGWQNMLDGTGPSHLHGWDGNNGGFRDDPHMYSGSDWDRNRHSSSRGWESGSENWKEQNGDLKKDLQSPAHKDESVPSQVDDGLPEQTVQVSQDEHIQDVSCEKTPETKISHLSSPAKVPLKSLPTTTLENASTQIDRTSLFSRSYLSKLDISAELALPELYEQCMCLLNVGKDACVDADASTDPYVKNDSRGRQKYGVTLSRCAPFPAIDTSIFQKAIDLYKKQKMEMPNGKLSIISASKQIQVDEPVPIPCVENMQVSEMENMPLTTLELKKVETTSAAKEDLEEEPDQIHILGQDKIRALPDPSAGQGLGEKEEKILSEQANSGDAMENHSAGKNSAQLASSTLHKGGDDMDGKAKSTGFAHCVDEKLGSGDPLGGPLIFEDGSSKACDALMPGSNESESLILSRIHHSPESTH
ncbi:hypothetical protein L6164_016321 [Bauhinia variegata]|uniref:Uncharacterized protein n=1 Tax=Bauhinia variegata TaxID=167791 RepID=A0ACB9NNA9_BAUVA|nr:hypothetical protein L6164_016321 [Bauhinia variegata]